MTIIGFNFNRMNALRNEGVQGKINIKNNVSIKDVKEHDVDIGGEQKAVKFIFEFTSTYDPGLGSITLGGDLVFIEKKDKVKSIIEEWKKAKRVQKEIMQDILNAVLTKCNIEALIISQKVNLPPPVPLPRVQGGSEK